ncbi:MAG: DNA-3-methyladenine glycosylase 2 family protein [Proteobacteria bacterium]|nr:DNA-3-methyladenine glycosylase 2 family protein [Pseudomonadota bacterium]
MSTASALDPKICEQARLTRDARFDGLFFTAVRTTGIYCRPVCPAPAALSRNVEYFANAAAAASAGYRPCLRCRPEAAPATPATRASSELVAAALRMIDAGALDEASVAQLARRIGVGERHLRRLFVAELGAGPAEIAATRRLLFAKKLLTETALPVTRIAHAAGYASLRRFNTAFLDGYGRAPRVIRREQSTPASGALTLRVPFRAPYDFSALLAFFARRAIPGLEHVDGHGYTRRFAFDGKAGSLRVTRMRGEDALALTVDFPDTARLQAICARVRRLFDVDADIAAITAQLAGDPRLHGHVRKHPGQRLPGGWDGFEIAVRAVLGQQISVAAARTLATRLLERFGEPAPLPDGETIRLFPTPQSLADADLARIGLPRTRAQTLNAMARALCDGTVTFRPEQSLDAFVASWCELPGIGAWTAHYIAMRALSHPDAFPAADLVLRKALGAGGAPASARDVETRAECWRPWRAYAVMHLWRNS